jgi:hypothetical protein
MAARIRRSAVHDVVFVLALFAAVGQGFQPRQALALGQRRAVAPARTLPEHLIDCAANPALAELYGGNGSAYCLQGSMGPFSGFGSIIEQALTIGFLVSTYFFFKRSQGGIIDWNETSVDDDWVIEEEADDFDVSDKEFTEAFDRMQKRDRSKNRSCPQCGGSGRFSWTAVSTPARCDMCLGSGVIIARSSSLTAGMRGSRRALPPIVDTDLAPDLDNEESGDRGSRS